MLFFKDIKEDFLEDPTFKAFYEQECHICLTTMAIVSGLEQMGDEGTALLKRLGIAEDAYKALARGDRCNPEAVRRLTAALGIEKPGMFDNCPSLPPR